jgi:hypothetical protein
MERLSPSSSANLDHAEIDRSVTAPTIMAIAVDHPTTRTATATVHCLRPAETQSSGRIGLLVHSALGHVPTYMIDSGLASALTLLAAGS